MSSGCNKDRTGYVTGDPCWYGSSQEPEEKKLVVEAGPDLMEEELFVFDGKGHIEGVERQGRESVVGTIAEIDGIFGGCD